MKETIVMFDKLHIRSHSCITDEKINEVFYKGFLGKQSIKCNKYKNSIILTKKGEHLVSIKRKPIFKNLWPTYLELNPVNFINLNDLLDFLDNLGIDTHEAEIVRIDHRADKSISLWEVKASLIVKYKRLRDSFKDIFIDRVTFTGMSFGTGKERICIYDKAFQLIKRDKFKRSRNKRLGIITRFEVRQKNEKVPFKKLHELSRYIEIDPFEKLTFYKPNSLLARKKSTCLSIKDQCFLKMIEETGMHLVSSISNKNGNFKRDYSKKLKETGLSKDLKAIYDEGILGFIGH